MTPVNPEDTKQLTLLQTLGGLVLRPIETVDRLFVNPNPVHTVLIFFLMLLTVLAPVLASIKTHGRWLYDPAAVLSLVMVLCFTFVYFILIEQLFLRFLKVRIDLFDLAHAACYCMVPLIMVIWCLYLYNILDAGGLTFVNFMIAGVPKKAEPLVEVVPFLMNLAFLGCFVVFFRALKALNKMYTSNAFIIGILSLVPFHLALILAVMTADQISPGTTDVFMRLLYAPDSLLM